jgi:hypothetical protein
MNAYRITIAIILVSLACLAGYAWERGKHKRFARAWAEEILNPTYTLIK